MVAERPNVHLRFDGLGTKLYGYILHEEDQPTPSAELVRRGTPVFETCCEAFGPSGITDGHVSLRYAAAAADHYPISEELRDVRLL